MEESTVQFQKDQRIKDVKTSFVVKTRFLTSLNLNFCLKTKKLAGINSHNPHTAINSRYDKNIDIAYMFYNDQLIRLQWISIKIFYKVLSLLHLQNKKFKS
jgi:hypothetical protein